MVDKVGRVKSTVTVMINTLERHGYVQKLACDTDNRITLIELTPAGKRLQRDFGEISRQVLPVLYRDMKQKDRQTLVNLLAIVESNLNFTQSPITDIHHAIPGDSIGIDIETGDAAPFECGIALAAFVEHACIQGCRNQIVRHGNRVNVTGQVQVEIFHRDYLAVTATSRAPLDIKGWPHAGLPDTQHNILVQLT